MFRGILRSIRPVCRCIAQTRNIRPTIRISKGLFQLTIDVRNFNKDEIRIKARPEYVLIEGKQERKLKNGYVVRQFTKKYKLPKGCSPERMESKLSDDGILTISAMRSVCDPQLPCDVNVPITFSGPKRPTSSYVHVDDSLFVKKDPCEVYLRICRERDDGYCGQPLPPSPTIEKKDLPPQSPKSSLSDTVKKETPEPTPDDKKKQ